MGRMAGELQVTVEPWGPSPDAVEAAARNALQGAAVRAALDGSDARMVAVRPVEIGSGPEPAARVQATLYDYRTERALLVEAPLAEDAAPVVRSSSRQPLPSPEEREAALAVLRKDPALGPELMGNRLVPYRAKSVARSGRYCGAGLKVRVT